MRIVFFGDSLTVGEYGGDFVSEVARLMPEHEIINAGEGGNTVLNLLERLDQDVLAHQPDGVFVMIGGNDAIAYSQPETHSYYRRNGGIPDDGAMTPELFTQSYRDLLTQLQAAHVLTWAGLPPNEYNAETVEALRVFNEAAREIAASLNVPVLDLSAAFPVTILPERPLLSMKTIRLIGERIGSGWHDYENERQRGGFTFTFDGLHLMPEAAQRAARLIADFLASH